MVENAEFFARMRAAEIAAHAAQFHRNAGERYAALAQLHASHADLSVPNAFHTLAQEELSLSSAMAGVDDNTVQHRETHNPFHDDDMMIRNPASIDGYAVMAMATRNAERMFDYWSYASAHAREPEAQAVAEHLAHRALQLASERRVRRRAAFRAGRDQRAMAGPRAAADIENELAADLAATGQQAAALSRRIGHALHGRAVLRRIGVPEAVQSDRAALCEFLADLYVEAAGDSASREETQFWRGVTDLALQRLALMRQQKQQPSS